MPMYPPAGAYESLDGQFYKWAGTWRYNTRDAPRVENPDLLDKLEYEFQNHRTAKAEVRREENADEYAARMAKLRADLNYDAFYRQRGIWYRKRNDTPVESLFLSTQLEGEYQQRMTEANMGCDSGPSYNDIVKSEPSALAGPPEHNVITHPKHYTNKVPPTDKHPNGIECYEVIMWFPTMVGSAIKYLWRAGDKDDELQDLRKAKQFIDFRIEQIEQQRKHAQPEPQRKEPA